MEIVSPTLAGLMSDKTSVPSAWVTSGWQGMLTMTCGPKIESQELSKCGAFPRGNIWTGKSGPVTPLALTFRSSRAGTSMGVAGQGLGGSTEYGSHTPSVGICTVTRVMEQTGDGG